jgi:PAS domain S-box-containing protein
VKGSPVYTITEALALKTTDVVAPEYGHLVAEMIKRKLRGAERSLYEIEIITKDGTRLPVEVSTHLIWQRGKPVGIQGIARDITQRRQREALFVESEQRYRQLVNEATDIIYRTDLIGHFTFVNPIGSKLMQRPMNELIGLHFLELIREDYREKAQQFYGRQVREKVSTSYFEFPTVTGMGTEVWIGQNVQLLLREGKPFELQAVARDITKRKQVENQLVESERRYRSLFNASPHPVWAYDVESLLIVAVNDAAVRTYGYSREEFLTLTVKQIWQDEKVVFSDDRSRCPTLSGGHKHTCEDGSRIEVDVDCVPNGFGR